MNHFTQDDRENGPKVTAIGGGTGLSTLLSGLKHETTNLAAIVNVTDDGGSSGSLRTSLAIPPMGDARSCLSALSASESIIRELFQYRFKKHSDLNGHSLGNLILAALYEITGDFQKSLDEAATLLNAHGKVIPVSNRNNLVLMGKTIFGTILTGESAFTSNSEPIAEVWLDPEMAEANESAVRSIKESDLIIIGPGSLYTSIIPNFLVSGISEAIVASPAPKIFICNVATQPNETTGYDANQHLNTFLKHSKISVDHFLVNNNVKRLPDASGQVAIEPPLVRNDIVWPASVIEADIVDKSLPTRHDPEKLSKAIMSIQRHKTKRA